jgi:nucleoside-diphosphate-sugar epimerase
VPVDSGGSREEDALTPIGEYANASIARERIFEYHSRTSGVRVCLIRLNYAVEMRYGVLVDIARKVHDRVPVDVSMGYLNCIWQGDANDMIVRALDLAESPARPLNLTGAETLSVRDLAERFAGLMGVPVEIVGREAPTALLSDSSRAHELLGAPVVPIDRVVEWTSAWITAERRILDKPTHFEVSDGRY